MQNTDAVAWTKKLVGIESTNPGKEEYEIAGFLEQEIRAALPERGELKKDYTREGRPVLLAVLPGETKEEMVLICHMDTVPVAGGWTKNPLGEDGENGRFLRHEIRSCLRTVCVSGSCGTDEGKRQGSETYLKVDRDL